YDGDLDMSIYYNNGSGDYQGWQNSGIDPDTNPHFEVDCSGSVPTLHANLTGDTPMTYDEISLTGSDNKWYFAPDIKNGDVDDTVTFDQHAADGPTTYAEGSDTEEMGVLLNHYFSLMAPGFELEVTDGPGGSSRVDEGASDGTLDYDAASGAQYITFLHITENEVRVELH
ncbi:MAG: DUF7308 domain-containing protein, partial [Halobacteriota archaeon]